MYQFCIIIIIVIIIIIIIIRRLEILLYSEEQLKYIKIVFHF